MAAGSPPTKSKRKGSGAAKMVYRPVSKSLHEGEEALESKALRKRGVDE